MNPLANSRQNEPPLPELLWRHSATSVPSRRLVWRVLPSVLVRLVRRFLRFWYAQRSEARSFHGHIQTRLARKHSAFDLGLESQCSPDGHLVGNDWTKARSAGIQALVSAHPWASTTDLQIFLEGVHTGERSALRILAFDSDKQVLAIVAIEPSIVLSGERNSMPLSEVQQSTKCDLSAPLPLPGSREGFGESGIAGSAAQR
jgi:hypothetical protein